MKKILFLQLPLLDTDVTGRHENVPLAAIYLQHALEQDSEGNYWSCRHITKQADTLNDQSLLRIITRIKPDAIAATLYLWNIERTLHLLARVRAAFPHTHIIVGGPEVARDHPFLFKRNIPDVAVYGEGEPVFPHILRALRTGRCADFSNVAWRCGKKFSWGKKTPPPYSLKTNLPPPRYRGWKPDPHGMAYLETTRGCPLRCAFCCYGHRRSRITALPAKEVLERIRVLRARGAREIRFIDPTFNAHPEFDIIISGIAALNRDRRLEFFCELRAETLTAKQALLLARANFREIEVGMQSRNPETLRLIRRPTRLDKLDRGIELLTRAGVRVTVDLMYGLPGQALDDIRTMIRWAARQRGVRMQCLQTLLLPGTELRARGKELTLTAADKPPYPVQSTASLSASDIRHAEQMARETLGVQMDCPMPYFVGRQFPGLFSERNSANRRAMIFRGKDLYGLREAIAYRIKDVLRNEPHILWQFVIEPDYEEPLDLLEYFIATIQEHEPLVLDRFLDMHSPGKKAARRLMIQLRPGKRYGRDWQAAAEELLRTAFF